MEATSGKTIKTRRHLSEAGWRETFERYGSAGMTVEEFCRQEGLCRSSFTRWRAKLRRGDAVSAIRREPDGDKGASSFVELSALGVPAGAAPASTASGLELHLDLGAGLTLSLMRR